MKPLPTSWTLWPEPDPDVFGDKIYSWNFFIQINVPIVLGLYALLVFTPLKEWTGCDPLVLAVGGALQLGSFVAVLAAGHRRIPPAARELLTYGGNLAAAIALPLSSDKALFALWVLYLLLVFFEAYGNPKAVMAFLLTLLAPVFSLVGHMEGPQARDKILLAALMAALGGVIYLLASYVAGLTRQGALDKAERALAMGLHEGAREERARIERTLDETLGSALAEIAIWHEVALASDVEGAREASLTKARARARETLTELRALMAGIDDRPAKMAGLAGEIQRRAGNLCAAAGIEFDIRIEALGKISLSEAYHMAMFAIEAVENAIAHGRPQRVTVSLSGAPLGVTVEDDGAGFDPATAPRGRGMRNLETLAKSLGANLTLDAAPGKGTRVRVIAARG